MERAQRRYPRVACDQQAELDIGTGAACQVAIRSLSCEGMGLAVDALPASCARDQPVRVRLDAFGEPVEIHGRVAWFQPDTGWPVNLGLRLDVEPGSEARPWADLVYAHLIADRQHAAALGRALIEEIGVDATAVAEALEQHARTGEAMADIVRRRQLCSEDELARASASASARVDEVARADVHPSVRAWYARFATSERS